MMSSSASRREAARSCDLGRTSGVEPPPRPAPAPATAAKARSGELLPLPAAAASVRQEGWMVRYGRRKIGRSFFHHRYFVLDNRVLAYYKKQPKDNMVRSSEPHVRLYLYMLAAWLFRSFQSRDPPGTGSFC
jgi:hypothetical protein